MSDKTFCIVLSLTTGLSILGLIICIYGIVNQVIWMVPFGWFIGVVFLLLGCMLEKRYGGTNDGRYL